MADAQVAKLLGELTALMEEHGARSEPVRQFILANRTVEDFESLATTLVFLKVEACKSLGRPS